MKIYETVMKQRGDLNMKFKIFLSRRKPVNAIIERTIKTDLKIFFGSNFLLVNTRSSVVKNFPTIINDNILSRDIWSFI